MNRKAMSIGLFLLLIGTCIVPISAKDIGMYLMQPSTTSDQTELCHLMAPRGGFGLYSAIRISWDTNQTEEPFEPGGAPRNVNFTLTYYIIDYYRFIGKLILLYCLLTHQNVTVTLEIGDISSWCTAVLSESQLHFPVSGTESSQTFSLAVAVDEHAPAYDIGTITLHVSVETIRGPFGLLPFVNEGSQTAAMSFLPGYLPHIIVEPADDHINVTPGNTSFLPITVTNHGNARTVVFVNIVDFPSGDWLISIPSQVALEVNTSNMICLSVVPPMNFQGTDSITISFTPVKADNYTQQGDPVNITISLIGEP